MDLDTLERRIVSEAGALRRATQRGTLGAGIALFSAPVLSFATLVGSFVIVVSVPLEPHDGRRYVEITRNGRTCIAVYRAGPPPQARFPRPLPGFRYEESLAQHEDHPIGARSLAGRELEIDGRSGVVRDVQGTLFGDNEVDLGFGFRDAAGSCRPSAAERP